MIRSLRGTQEKRTLSASQAPYQKTVPHGHHRVSRPNYYQHQVEVTETLPDRPTGTSPSNAETAAIMVEVVILAFALVVLAVGMFTRDPQIGDLFINFIAILLEAMPFMLLGAVLGGIIEVFVSQDFVQRALTGHTTATVFIAAGLGMIFPVCECAIIPIVRRLINKGVPMPAAIAFLLGAPIVNPLVAASTLLAYRGNLGMVCTRMVCGYVIAVCVALILGTLFRRDSDALVIGTATCEHGCCCHCGEDHHHHEQVGFLSKTLEALAHARDDFFSIGKFLIIGAFVASLARATIDVVAFRDLFGSPILSILAMMGLAVTLNLCSQTDAFIAAGFRTVFPDTAQMAFMVLGPMLDLKLLLTYFTVFKSRVIGALALVTLIAVLLAMMTLHYGFGGVPGAR